jgi:hypothetical protein
MNFHNRETGETMAVSAMPAPCSAPMEAQDITPWTPYSAAVFIAGFLMLLPRTIALLPLLLGVIRDHRA